MKPFHETLVEGASDLLARTRSHPLLVDITSGTFPRERFVYWITQVYLYVRTYEDVLAGLSARTPPRFRKRVVESLLNIQGDIDLFEEMVSQTGIDLATAKPNFALIRQATAFSTA